jgi:hypothetical protein
MTNAERCAQAALIAQFAPFLSDDEKLMHERDTKQIDAEAWSRIRSVPQKDLFQGA